MTTTFAPQVGTLVTVAVGGQKMKAVFEAFTNDMLDTLVSVAGTPKQHVGADHLFWVPTADVVFHC